ncbi:hypothetical protein [Flaviaesturariibacter amylovorans]
METPLTKTRLIPYRSPVRPVLHAGEPLAPFSQQTLQRARKKLLAELALSNDELQLDGLTYTRNDLTVLFQDMTESEWSGHCLLYSIPGLLQFLEESRFDAEAMAPARQYHYKPGFTAFVSAWFAPAFRDASGRFIRDSAPRPLVELFRFADFIAPEDSTEAYERLRIYFEELGFLLRNWTWEKMQEDPSRIGCLFDPDWIAFLNALPEPLAPARDAVVEQFLGIVYRLQHKATWKLLQKMCAQLQQVRCNPELRTQVDEYESIMRGNMTTIATRNSKSSGGGWSLGRGAWAIGWILLMVIRALTSDSCNRPKSYHNLEYVPRTTIVPAPASESDRPAGNNERLRLALADLVSVKEHAGTSQKIATGTAPFNGISTLPTDSGAATLAVHNKTGYDMVLLVMSPRRPLRDRYGGLQAVYLRSGAMHTISLNPEEDLLKAVFGTGWVRLELPRRVFLVNEEGTGSARTIMPMFPISEFFRKPLDERRFLSADILLHKEPGIGDPASVPFHTPSRKGKAPNALTFVKKGSRIDVRGEGTYYMSVSKTQD